MIPQDKKRNVWCIAGIALIMAGAALAEAAMGRRLWGVKGQPGFWSGNVSSEHNSQFLFDPYSFSHVNHGLFFYGLLWLAARKLSVRARLLMAAAIEAGWEVLENTDWLIETYRARTISLHYYGDSIINSQCDILAMAAGFLLASVLPARWAIAAVIGIEIVLALWIRDNTVLNVIMLLYPVEAIKSWQMGL